MIAWYFVMNENWPIQCSNLDILSSEYILNFMYNMTVFSLLKIL